VRKPSLDIVLGTVVLVAAFALAARVVGGLVVGVKRSSTVEVVLFENARNVRTGTDVFFNGVWVGYVWSVEPFPSGRDRTKWISRVLHQAQIDWFHRWGRRHGRRPPASWPQRLALLWFGVPRDELRSHPWPEAGRARVATIHLVEEEAGVPLKPAPRATVEPNFVTGVATVYLSNDRPEDVTSPPSKTVLSTPARGFSDQVDGWMTGVENAANGTQDANAWCTRHADAAKDLDTHIDSFARALSGVSGAIGGPTPVPTTPDEHPSRDALKWLRDQREGLERLTQSVREATRECREARERIELWRRQIEDLDAALPGLGQGWTTGLDSTSDSISSLLRLLDSLEGLTGGAGTRPGDERE